jgi:hypothetical protein
MAPLSETDRFAGFFEMLGYRLRRFQRLIVEECFSPRRETLILIPRPNGKSTLLAGLALWELLKNPQAQIVVGAASREQASVLFDIARGMAQHPEVAPLVEVTRREIRTSTGWLKVIAADGPCQHGLIVDLAIVDELHAHRHDELYIALRTSLQKRPGARMITISTAGARVETPLGRLRDRALKLPKVKRDGAFTRAEGEHLAMLAWELPEGADPNDLEVAKAATRLPGSPLRASPSRRRRSTPSLGSAITSTSGRRRGALDPPRPVGRERRRARDRGGRSRRRRRRRFGRPRHHRGLRGAEGRRGRLPCLLAGLGAE